MIDFSIYLSRLGFKKVPPVELKSLQALQRAHLLRIPFENLDIHRKVRIELDTHKIFTKVMANNRGGFCYELNGIFYELLTHIGFQVKRVSAQVYSEEKGYSPPHDHMALVVQIEGQDYLSDVGYGEFAFSPLALRFNERQADKRGTFIVDEFRDGFLRVRKLNEKEEEKTEYIFKPIAQAFDVFDERCVHQQDDPDSHFRQKKLISRATKKGRITISGSLLKIRKGTKVSEKLLTDEKAFDKALWKYFKIKF